MHKIALIDPSPIVLNGLSAMLHELPDCEVVLKATDLLSVASRISVLKPEVLLINPLVVDFSRRMVVRTLFEEVPTMKIVALVTSFVDTPQLRQYQGVVELNDDLQRLKSTLNTVFAIDNSEEEDNESAQLSDREREVLICLSKGLKNNEIADKLTISVHTVVTHRKNIVRKTGIKSVSALTVYAILNNLIDEKDII